MFYNSKKHMWEARWKDSRQFPIQTYDTLECFALKNPSYSEAFLLEQMKLKPKNSFEDDRLLLKKIKYTPKGIPGERPKLRDNFFWDADIPGTDWNECYQYVIGRVLARGQEKDFLELIRFYGYDTVLDVFMNQTTSFWPEDMEDDARRYFKLDREDLLIYHHRRADDGWNVWKKNYMGQDDIKEA